MNGTLYYCEVVYNSGQYARFWLSEGTWTHWGGRCACVKDNPFAKGLVLVGLNHTNNPICLRTRDISSLEFGETVSPQQSQVTPPNPLNEEDHYDNPTN